MKNYDIFLNQYPQLDLHGEYPTTIKTLVNNFINDNLKLKNKIVVIIHGKGTGALKKELHMILKEHKMVESFHLNNNLGSTILYLTI